jgi:hypothetical protein
MLDISTRNSERKGSEFRVEMSNILSYHMSLRSEFRVEMFNILSYHMSLRSEFRVEMSYILSYRIHMIGQNVGHLNTELRT